MEDIQLPDLRFEQSFMRSLHAYAHKSYSSRNTKKLKKHDITEEELKLLNQELDDKEQEQLESEELTPLQPITPGIIIYAVVKDQIIMPLLQGFLWAGILITSKPVLQALVFQGQKCGVWVSTILGLNRLTKPRSPRVL